MKKLDLQPMTPLLALALNEPTFREFWWASLHGVAREHRRGIELLAIISHNKGAGNFKRLLDKLEVAYARVTVWDIVNARLARMLRRRGYVPLTRKVDGWKRSGLTKRRKRGTHSRTDTHSPQHAGGSMNR